MNDDYLEQLRKFQESINKSFLPLQRFQSQFEIMHKGIIPMFKYDNWVQDSFKPIIEAALKEQEIMYRGLSSVISESTKRQMSQIQDAFKEMHRIPKLDFPIPQLIYPELELLFDLIHDDLPVEDSTDMQSSITIRSPELVEAKQNPLTWGQLLTLLIMIFQTLYPIYSDSQTSLQRERIHEEQMEQAERHHDEDMAQKDRHHQEKLSQDNRQHQESMDAFEQFISFIAPLIPSGEELEGEDRQDQ
jgi:hypothetical protein